MTAPGGTNACTPALDLSAGPPPRWPHLVLRSAFVLIASAGLSIAFTRGVAAADPLLPAPEGSSTELTDALTDQSAAPLELAVDTTELAVDTTELAVDTTELAVDTTELAVDTTETAADAVVPGVDAATPIVEPVTDTLEPVTDTLQPVTDTLQPVTDTLEPVTDTVAVIAEPITDVVAPVLAPIVDASAPVTDQVVTILQPVDDAIAPITQSVDEAAQLIPRISRPTDPVIEPLDATRSVDRTAATRAPVPIDLEPMLLAQRRSDGTHATAPGTIGFAAPAPPAVIAFAETAAAAVQPRQAGPDRPKIASLTPVSSVGHGGVDWTPMAVFGTLLLLGLVSRALITTAHLRPPTVALFVPVPPG